MCAAVSLPLACNNIRPVFCSSWESERNTNANALMPFSQTNGRNYSKF